jgi:hypothetical protein
VNVKRLVETLMRREPDSEKVVKAMGIDRVTGMAVGLQAAPQSGSSLAARGYIRTSGGKQGILRMLDMAPVALNVPDFVAGDSCSFALINIDISAVYDEIFRIANGIDPRAAAAIGSPMTAPLPDGRPGVELKRDILAYLRPGLWSVDTPRKVAGTDQPEILSVGAVAINDRAKLESSLSRLHEQYLGNNKELRREFLGHVIYSLSFGTAWEGDQSPGSETLTGEPAERQQAPAFTVTDSYLLFGDTKLIEDAIRAMQDKAASRLPSARWYRRAAAAIPSPAGSSGMMDLSVYGRYIWNLLKTGKTDSPAEFIVEDLRRHGDFSRLPEFDKVGKYFGIIVSQFFSQPDGFTFEYRMLSPAEE